MHHNVILSVFLQVFGIKERKIESEMYNYLETTCNL